jgi:subtilase family serine protease
MTMRIIAALSFFTAGLVVAVGLDLIAPASSSAAQAEPPLITQRWDERSLVPMAGTVRSEANPRNDRGRVSDSLVLESMQLVLRRSYQREQSLEALIEQLHRPGSPQFHHWLKPQQFGEQFGVAKADTDAITRWLTQHGFTVNVVYPNRMLIDFSGTARQVREAFHTEIHHLMVNGRQHFANMSQPQIPAALAPAVLGVVSLHDFRPHAMFKKRRLQWAGSQFTFTQQGTTVEAVVPADLATIYNLNPLFAAGNSGQGQTVVVIEDSNVYSSRDWATFRSAFGLSNFTSGSFTQVHPVAGSGMNNCDNPGDVSGSDEEAILDAEWASAAAPSAKIEVASCADTRTTFGGLIALNNLLNGTSAPPAIVSISYGECEALNGAAANAAYFSAYQQAVAEGVSVFVSAGDAGAASCDDDQAQATHGIGISGFASTPYNVAVGGTDFGDTFTGTTGAYWGARNSATFGSAISYIPEIPWNNSCASVLLSSFRGFVTTFGAAGFCNSPAGEADFLTTGAGGGGPSNCAAGSPAIPGVASGSCEGMPKPPWQSGIVGNPADGVRDIPDISLFASNGVWGHFYIVCYSNAGGGGTPCSGAPSGWTAAGGTSFASPILAGIQALVNQRTAERWGNPNPTYYALAQAEYVSGAPCNSSAGRATDGSCVFHDVTQGDSDVDCGGSIYCYLPSGINGALSTSGMTYEPAFVAGAGWDFATGLGSVNAFNLVMAWPAGTASASAAHR